MKANAPNIDELIEAAADRDTVALSRLYGQAAAWIKAGKAPPEPLAGWIADRMQGLAESLHQHSDRKKTEAAAARALMIRRDKSGRAPARKTKIMDAALIGDVQHFIGQGMEPYQAIEAAAKFHRRNGGPDLKEKIVTAWKQRRN